MAHIGDEMRKKAIAAAGIGNLVMQRVGAWRFGLSYEPGLGLWMFSAQLFPVGRGSTLHEWSELGKYAALVGVPEGLRELGRTVETHPNAVHKWAWIERDGQKIGLDNLDDAAPIVA